MDMHALLYLKWIANNTWHMELCSIKFPSLKCLLNKPTNKYMIVKKKKTDLVDRPVFIAYGRYLEQTE